jgi:hypothetical protein
MPINLQPNYNVTQPIAFPGMPATMTTWDADTFTYDKDAVARLPFGVAVSRQAGSDGKVCVLGGTAAAFAGVTYRDITEMPVLPTVDGYPPGHNVGVMIRGDIWVLVTDAVAVGDVPKFVTATGVFAAAGTILLPTARWMRGAGAGGLALLRLGMPHQLPDAT